MDAEGHLNAGFRAFHEIGQFSKKLEQEYRHGLLKQRITELVDHGLVDPEQSLTHSFSVSSKLQQQMDLANSEVDSLEKLIKLLEWRYNKYMTVTVPILQQDPALLDTLDDHEKECHECNGTNIQDEINSLKSKLFTALQKQDTVENKIKAVRKENTSGNSKNLVPFKENQEWHWYAQYLAPVFENNGIASKGEDPARVYIKIKNYLTIKANEATREKLRELFMRWATAIREKVSKIVIINNNLNLE